MKKILFLFLFFILIISGIFFFIDFFAESVIKYSIEKYSPQILGVQVNVSSVSTSVSNQSISFNGIRVQNPKGFKNANVMEFAKVNASLNLESLNESTIKVYNLEFFNPTINYEINEEGKDNLRTLIKQVKRKNSSNNKKLDDGESNKESKKVIIRNLVIDGMKLNVSFPPSPSHKTLNIPRLKIQNIGKNENGITYGNAAEVILLKLQEHITINEINNILRDTKSLQNIVNNEIDKIKKGDSKLVDNLIGSILKNK